MIPVPRPGAPKSVRTAAKILEDEKAKELRIAKARYHEACAAVHRGVEWKWQRDDIGADTNTTTLRIDINVVLVETRALARLLLDKGVFTDLEYFTALGDAAE